MVYYLNSLDTYITMFTTRGIYVLLIALLFATSVMAGSGDTNLEDSDKAGIIIGIIAGVCCLPCIIAALIVLLLVALFLSIPLSLVLFLLMPCICIGGLVAIIFIANM